MRNSNQTFVLERPDYALDLGPLQRTREAPPPLLVRAPARLPTSCGYTRKPRYAPAFLVVAVVTVVVIMVAGAGYIHGAAGNQGHHTYCK